MPIGRTIRHALCVVGSLALAGSAAPAYAVESSADTTPRAELRSLAATPSAVDVSTAPATVAMAARVTSPHLASAVQLRLGGGTAVPLQLTAGTLADGTWYGVVPVPAFTRHGALDAFVTVTDAAAGVTSVGVPGVVSVADAAPAVPAAIAAAAVPGDADALRVEWAAPPANGGSDVTSYVVTAEPAPGTDLAVVPASVTTGPDARSATFDLLSAGTRYVFRVAARNAAGLGTDAVADATTPGTGVTVPDAPTSVVATPGAGSLALSWTPPRSDGGSVLTGYEVRAVPRVTAPQPPVVTLAPDAVSAPLTGLRNGVTYDVSVVARNAAGPSLAGVGAGRPRTVPGAPAISTVSPGDGLAVVRWNAPSSDGGAPIHSYAVTASPSGTVVTVPASARSVTVKRLPNGVAATFTVVARNVAGTGARSGAKTVTPRRPARLVVNTQPVTQITYRTETVVGATMLDAANAAVSGQRVELKAQVRPSTTWKVVAAGTTSSTGRVTLRATLPATSALRLHHPPNAVGAPDVSVRSVYVAPRVTAGPNATSLRLGQTLAVTGNIAPAHPVGTAVKLQRYVSGAWQNVATGSLTTSTAYRVSWRPGTAGYYPMRVLLPAHTDHTTGVSAKWSQRVTGETTADIARAILNDGGITLARTHMSGISDLANARQNVVDVANGYLARRSAYQNAPGGYTALDQRVLRAIRYMGTVGTITVSEVAGGSHAVGSAHYYGRAVDINYVNGRHVRYGSGYQMALDACRAFGASKIYHPSYDPYGGHSGHIHCEWP